MLKIDGMLMKINYNFSTSELGIDISKFISYMTEKGIQRRTKIKDLKIVFPPMKSISLALVNPQYHHAFYTIQAFSFKGKFGNNPDVYMIFSKDDNPIKLRRLEQQVDTVVAVRLKQISIINGQYKYGISKQCNYFSNKKSKYDMRPFILFVVGNNSVGFAVIDVINKSYSENTGNHGKANLFGKGMFYPYKKIMTWPKKSELYKPVQYPFNKRLRFELSDDEIGQLLSLKRELIHKFSSNRKIENALNDL